MKNIHSFDFLLKKWNGAWANWKTKFAEINDKRYYFSDGIVSLSFSNPFLHEINQFKKDKNKKIDTFLLDEIDKLLCMEKML